VGAVNVSHLRDQFLMDQRRSDRQDKYEDTRLNLVQTNLQSDIPLPLQNVLSVGVDGFAETARNPRIVRSEDCEPGGLDAACITAERLRGAVYLQDVFTALLDPYLVFVFGARVEGDNRFGNESVPRFAMRYDPIEAVAIRASVGKGYRAPTFKELYLRFDNPSEGYTVRGNQSLSPESSLSYQASVDAQLTPVYTVHTAVFRNDIDDLIDFRLVSSASEMGAVDLYQLTNAGNIRTTGGIFELTVRFIPGLELRTGYQYLSAENLTASRPLQGRAKHQVSGALQWRSQSSGFSVGAQAVYIGARPFYVLEPTGDERRVTADPYTNLSTTLGYQIVEYLRAFIRGENLLNAGQTTYLAQRPRRFVLGLSAGF